MGTRTALRRAGFLALAALFAVSVLAGAGTVAADEHNGDEEVFSDPVEIDTAGLTLTVGPPEDVDDDDVYSDINGDGEVTALDGVLHAVVVTAVEDDELDLTDEQAAALDVNDDGEVGYDDAAEIVFTSDFEDDLTDKLEG